MTKTFTQNDVIRYIYEELSDSECEEIERTILCDTALQELYKDLVAVKKQLDKGLKTPSNRVTESILNYSKSLNLHSNK